MESAASLLNGTRTGRTPWMCQSGSSCGRYSASTIRSLPICYLRVAGEKRIKSPRHLECFLSVQNWKRCEPGPARAQCRAGATASGRWPYETRCVQADGQALCGGAEEAIGARLCRTGGRRIGISPCQASKSARGGSVILCCVSSEKYR